VRSKWLPGLIAGKYSQIKSGKEMNYSASKMV